MIPEKVKKFMKENPDDKRYMTTIRWESNNPKDGGTRFVTDLITGNLYEEEIAMED